MFKDKVVVITGGANGIGKKIAEDFRDRGAKVCIVDKEENDYFIGDISKESVLRDFAARVIKDHGRIDFLINNACLSRGGIFSCDYEDFNYVLRTGVTAPFMLAKLFQDHFTEKGAIVNISSTRDRMSQRDTESYTAAKGGIAALTHGLAVSLSGRVRVNSISPGWIETGDVEYSGSNNSQHPAGRVGKSEDISNMAMYLCSDAASFITGENITIDGGMTRLMIYHNDQGWIYKG
ncbi:SDR family oxidoreductase [Gudongella sp. SC589]|jgi:NAD(P)-dependent dehydrogenase (short-subunit alcohol dehydrogenase family)|uniref:SDR family oxidoreductase n=1 Tax=Gudongella sp. SC589 TaxID=3385990 RepID=UPI003904A401